MLSVIIITLNEETYIEGILSDLEKQTYTDIEVIVVDSGSTDKTKEKVMSYKDSLSPSFFTLKQPSVSGGRNTGAEKAKGNLLCFFDADTRIQKDFLKKAVTEMEQRKLDAAGVYVQSTGTHPIDVLYYAFLNLWFFLFQKIYPHCVGSCIFVKKSTHTKVQGFDESITLAEDNDYVQRIGKEFRYRMLSQKVAVSPRRFEKEGRIKMGLLYIRVFFHRLFIGEIKKEKIPYTFGHYEK